MSGDGRVAPITFEIVGEQLIEVIVASILGAKDANDLLGLNFVLHANEMEKGVERLLIPVTRPNQIACAKVGARVLPFWMVAKASERE